VGVRPTVNPAHTAKRRENMAKAIAQRKKNAAVRRKAKAEGLPDPFPSLRPKPGRKWNFDEVVSAVLEADDAVESKRIVAALQQKASHGDVRAAEFLVERALGKPLQKVQVSGGLSLETLDQALPGVPEATADVDPIAAD
jgi:hypothetical protein